MVLFNPLGTIAAPATNIGTEESHLSQKGKLLKKHTGSGKITLEQSFDQPTRLLIHLQSNQSPLPRVTLTVRGTLSDGKKPQRKISAESIAWQQGRWTLTLPDLYTAVEQIEVKGLSEDDECSLSIVDHTLEDHTLLAPLWAGIPTLVQVNKLIKRKLGNKKSYFRHNGIPASPKMGKKEQPGLSDFVWLPWNVIIGEGMLAYGKQAEVVDLISRIMGGIIQNLKQEHAFRANYHAELPKTAGQRGSLVGLPPIGLFLKTLGVRPISPWCVEIASLNPFPWQVRVEYRGMQIVSNAEVVTVTFPDGEEYSVSGEIPCRIEHRPPSENDNPEGVNYGIA